MKEATRTMLFAAAVAVVCAVLVAGIADLTEPHREANARAAAIRSIVEVLDIPLPQEPSTRDILTAFEQSVRVANRGGLVLYEQVPAGASAPVAVAVPFSGPGLWGTISGVVALEPDLRTIRGLCFFRHEETPGLGGQIDTPAFRDRFAGKALSAGGTVPPLRIVQPGNPTTSQTVDGITGATMTGNRLEAILHDLAHQLEATL